MLLNIKEKQLWNYWQKQLAGKLPVLNLPTNRPRPPIYRYSSATHTFKLSKELTQQLRLFVEAEEVSLYTTLLAVLQVLLYRYTEQEDILVASANIAGQPGCSEIISNIKPVALRANISENLSFKAVIAQTQQIIQAAFEHQNYPFKLLVEQLAATQSDNRSSLFQVLFIFQHLYCEEEQLSMLTTEAQIDSKGLNLEIFAPEDQAELALVMLETSEAISGVITYNEELFNDATIARMVGHFQTLLESIVIDLNQNILELPLLSAAEQLLLVEFNNTQVEHFKNLCIHEIFEEQVEKTPEAIALISATKQLTYRELNAQANQLAYHLQALGVGPEVIVGICLERSWEMVVGILGILKAGGAYVFLDPAYPQERLAFMLAETQVSVLLTQQRVEIPVDNTHLVYLDTDWEAISQASVENLASAVTPQNLAYVMYTSGSTDKPKGVTITHNNVTHYVQAINARLQIEESDVYLHTASFSFSSSVRQLLLPLFQGAKVLIATRDQVRDPLKIFAVIEKSNVTVCDTVRSFWQYGLEALESLDQASKDNLLASKLRLIVFSGGLLTWEIPKAICSQFRHKPQIVNIYGQTETIGASSYQLNNEFDSEEGTVPTGRPIANTQIYILNSQLQPVPINVPGELHVGGDGLARGYLNRPELTAEKFISNPFQDQPTARLYKTGDLARYLSDGNIEIVGRIDDQVKVRGMRVELGEIESVLAQHPAVQSTVVMARDDEGGDKCLAAYIVPHRQYAPTIAGQSRYKLPNGMAIVHQNKNETDYLYYEIFEIETYLKHGITLPEHACVFDVGANIGMFTMFVNQHCPTARIYSFEPLQPIFETLRINAQLYGSNVKLFQMGMSNEEKVETFTYYPRHSMMSGISTYAKPEYEMEVVKTFMHNQQQGGITEAGSLLAQAEEILAGRYEGKSYECRLRRLSDVIREEGLERIDLLKIDVQRAEMDMLRGIESEDWAKIQQIVMEVHDVAGQENEGRVGEIITLLASRGFSTFVEQDDLLKGTDRYNLYATRCNNQEVLEAKPQDTAQQLPLLEIDPTNLSRDLRSFLTEKLPEYMVPAAFMILESLPLTPNGKIDRRALPKVDRVYPGLERAVVAPQNTLELELTKIWEEVLGIQPIGVKDNFFELGGHSLLAVRLFMQIEKKLGKNLPLATLFQAGTIEQLANTLIQQEGFAPWSLLVPIQTSGNKPPLFCPQGAGGNVLCYYELARCLGPDQPVYGLQAKGLDGKQAPYTRLEDMAADYIKEMRTVQPEGPYFLAGLSAGGKAAFEMAQQLHAQGQKVALLAMFDSYGPGYPQPLPTIPRLLSLIGYKGYQRLTKVYDMARLPQISSKEKLLSMLKKAIQPQPEQSDLLAVEIDAGAASASPQVNSSRFSLDQWIYDLNVALLKNTSWGYLTSRDQLLGITRPQPNSRQADHQFNNKSVTDDSFQQPQALKAVQRANIKASSRYVCKVYPGRITLFRASQQPPGYYHAPHLGWSGLTAEGLYIHVIPGVHWSIVKQPNVQLLAEKLQTCLAQAQAEDVNAKT